MLDKLNQLIESHGAMLRGHGLLSAVIALSLATLSFLGVLAFHCPEYLTTQQLSKSYNVDVMRRCTGRWCSLAASCCSTSASAVCAGCRSALSC